MIDGNRTLKMHNIFSELTPAAHQTIESLFDAYQLESLQYPGQTPKDLL